MSEKMKQGASLTMDVCPICEGKGYNRRVRGHVSAGVVHNFGVAMEYCQCKRGRELEQLVAQQCGKAWETGVQAGKAGALV